MDSLTIKETPVCYTIHYSKRMKRKSIKIMVRPSGVRVTAAVGVKQSAIQNFIQEKRAWIENHVAELQEQSRCQALTLPPRYEHGATMPYRGDMFPIIIEITGLKAPHIDFTGNAFKITTARKVNEITIQKLFKQWLSDKISHDIEAIFTTYSHILGHSPKEYRVKRQRTLWGSCSRRGNININFSLIFAPYAALEYVVVHEMCHLKHPNHSQCFWDEVERLLPDYRVHSRWLKDNNYIIDMGR